MDIYTKYGPALARKCERMLGNSHDAEDVVQALFVELIQKGKTDVVDLPYLYRAATNRCISILRSRKNRSRLLKKQEVVIAPPRSALDEQVMSLELLGKLVSRLDKKSAAILVYKYLDGMGHEEIGELLGVTRRTVHNKLQKVRKAAVKLATATEGGVRA